MLNNARQSPEWPDEHGLRYQLSEMKREYRTLLSRSPAPSPERECSASSWAISAASCRPGFWRGVGKPLVTVVHDSPLTERQNPRPECKGRSRFCKTPVRVLAPLIVAWPRPTLPPIILKHSTNLVAFNFCTWRCPAVPLREDAGQPAGTSPSRYNPRRWNSISSPRTNKNFVTPSKPLGLKSCPIVAYLHSYNHRTK